MYAFSFPAPAETLNLNKRIHWAKKASLTAAWREAAHIHGRNVNRRNKWGQLPPCVVNVIFNVPDRRRRDPHNWIATVKPIIDGLVDAGFWPDDTAEWVAVTDPQFMVVGRGQSPYRVSVKLVPR